MRTFVNLNNATVAATHVINVDQAFAEWTNQMILDLGIYTELKGEKIEYTKDYEIGNKDFTSFTATEYSKDGYITRLMYSKMDPKDLNDIALEFRYYYDTTGKHPVLSYALKIENGEVAGGMHCFNTKVIYRNADGGLTCITTVTSKTSQTSIFFDDPDKLFGTIRTTDTGEMSKKPFKRAVRYTPEKVNNTDLLYGLDGNVLIDAHDGDGGLKGEFSIHTADRTSRTYRLGYMWKEYFIKYDYRIDDIVSVTCDGKEYINYNEEVVDGNTIITIDVEYGNGLYEEYHAYYKLDSKGRVLFKEDSYSEEIRRFSYDEVHCA